MATAPWWCTEREVTRAAPGALAASSAAGGVTPAAGSVNAVPVAWEYSRAMPRMLNPYERSGVTLTSKTVSSEPRISRAS